MKAPQKEILYFLLFIVCTLLDIVYKFLL
uniref:Uncharacterized protein n=1 Tax=Rhizophora mucronata TaxID=61149 RepID=A0A2P2P2H0_RHIMU